jgi:serine/threonine protein kinase
MTDDQFRERYLIRDVVLERDYVVRSIAVDRMLGREILITQLAGRVGRMSGVQERFRAAARDAVRLSHQNVVALYDIGVADGMPYAIQEHAHSEPLRDVIASEGPFHPDDVAVLVEQVADALDYAAQRGLPHLALTPDAITVDYDGMVLVSDFGIGHVLTEVGPIETATLQYRAPEQIRGASGDYRSDIFSLGVMAYEMLTGSTPFDTTSIEALRESILSGQFTAPRSRNPEIPPAVSDAVSRALALRPEERFESAGHFAESLSERAESLTLPMRSLETPRPHTIERTEAMPVLSSVDRADAILDEHPERRTSRATAITAWLAVAVAIGALIWIAATLLDARGSDDPSDDRGAQGSSPTAVAAATSTPNAVPTAPSVIGLTVADADAQTDLTVSVAATEESQTVAEGQIIRQIPNPGSPVRNGVLSVIVSSGTGPEPVDLSGLNAAGSTFDAVAAQITALGLNVSQTFEGNADVAEGQVIRIEEETALPGSTVHVVVSMGDRVLVSNDLQSMPLDDVVRYLEDSGLDAGDPVAVSRERIESFGLDLESLEIVDKDVVGFQEESASFGQWVNRGDTVTPVYYDAALDS